MIPFVILHDPHAEFPRLPTPAMGLVNPGLPHAIPVAPVPPPAAGPGCPGPALRALLAAFNTGQIEYVNALVAYPVVLQLHKEAITVLGV